MTEMNKEAKVSSKHGTGEIWVNKFTEEAATKFREDIMMIALRDPNFPIIIYIDSYGGYVDSLAKMIDTLDQVANPIITVCMGKAMSCGAILLSCGDHRYCAPNSRVMVHEVSAGTYGDVHDNKNNADEDIRLNKHFLGLLATNCGFKNGYKGLRDFIKSHDGREIWLSPEDCLKIGIVDEVGTPYVIPQVTFQLATLKTMSREDRLKRSHEILGLQVAKKSTTKKKKKGK